MTETEKYLTERLADALDLKGRFRQVGDREIFVLDALSATKWGEYLFDPLHSNEHSFLVAGVGHLSLSFGTTHAQARQHGAVGAAKIEPYAAHADRWAAGRRAVALAMVELAAVPA